MTEDETQRSLEALLAFANSIEIKEAKDGEFWLMLNCGRRSTAIHLGPSHAIFDDIEQLRRGAIKKATSHD